MTFKWTFRSACLPAAILLLALGAAVPSGAVAQSRASPVSAVRGRSVEDLNQTALLVYQARSAEQAYARRVTPQLLAQRGAIETLQVEVSRLQGRTARTAQGRPQAQHRGS